MKLKVLYLIAAVFLIIPWLVKAAPSRAGTQDLAPFDRIIINNALRVYLKIGPNQITLQQPQCFAFAVNQGLLRISLNVINMLRYPECRTAGSQAVVIQTPMLSQITLSGTSTLSGKAEFAQDVLIQGSNNSSINLTMNKTQLHSLQYHGNGQVNLAGMLRLTHLVVTGNGALSIHWLDSPLLTVQARGYSQIALAGIAGTLSGQAFNHAHVDARYLRAQTIYFRTFDQSSAYLWAVKNLFASANKQSNIYYFNRRDFVAPFTSVSGNVLAMHDIPAALLTFRPPEFNR